MVRKYVKFFPIIGLLLFVYIISKIDLHAVAQNFLNIDLRFLALAFVLTIPSLLIKTLKWKQLVKPFNVELSLKEAASAWISGFFIGLVTPGRVGDLARAFYLKDKMKIGSALTTVVVDRILDIFVLMVLSVLGIFFIITNFAVDGKVIQMIFGAFVLFTIAAIVFFQKKYASRLLKPLFNIFVPEKYKEKLKSSYQDFYGGISILKANKGAIAKAVILSVVAWTITFTNYFVLSLAIGLNVEYFFILMIMPIALLVEILPISFSGIGTRDAAIILFFSFIGIDANSAVSLSLTILIFNYIYSLAGLAVWVKNPIKL